jgi:hypothetical protein
MTSLVRVPVIDVQMSTQTALWILAGLVFLNGLLLQATIQDLTPEDILQREEVWLVLDGQRGLARVLAAAWLWMIVVSPIVVPSSILLSAVLRAMAGGWSAGGLFWTTLLAISLAVLGGWCSTKTFRILRSANTRSIEPTRADT